MHEHAEELKIISKNIATSKEALPNTSSCNFESLDKTEQAGSNFCSSVSLNTCRIRNKTS